MAKTKKKNYTLVILLILLVGISVGYAAFSATLNIVGTANAGGTFALKFVEDPKPTVSEKGATNTKATVTSANTLTISTDLQYPGAGASIKATIKNDGSIAAKLTDIDFGKQSSNILVKYDGINPNDVIAPGATQDVTIYVKWADNSTEGVSNFSFTATLKYEQSTDAFGDIPDTALPNSNTTSTTTNTVTGTTNTENNV